MAQSRKTILMKTMVIGLSLLLLFQVFKSEKNVAISLEERALQAKTFCTKEGMNQNYAILIDMSIHSGKKRLFVWDFNQNKMIKKGMCSHGSGPKSWSNDDSKINPRFSNVVNSHYSSLGKYKIGKRGWSNFGIHVNYKLHGLDSSNSNAYKRIIVLHSWNIMPHEEVYPKGAPESWGCPAVSNTFMHELDSLLRPEKDVLLWIYND